MLRWAVFLLLYWVCCVSCDETVGIMISWYTLPSIYCWYMCYYRIYYRDLLQFTANPNTLPYICVETFAWRLLAACWFQKCSSFFERTVRLFCIWTSLWSKYIYILKRHEKGDSFGWKMVYILIRLNDFILPSWVIYAQWWGWTRLLLLISDICCD